MTLEQTIFAIRPLDEKSMTATRNRFANIAMPLGGLGLLQDAIVQLAGILGQPVPDISRRAAVVFCADNGVVAEGVTQCGQEVTATVAENMGHGESTVCLMAKHLGMDVFPVDIGVARPIKNEKVLQFAVRRGTANFAHEPAMTRKEALEAVFSSGAKRAICGSIAATQPDMFSRWLADFGPQRMVLGADTRDGLISINGWQQTATMGVEELIEHFRPVGLSQVICTDITQDGMLSGPSTSLYTKLQAAFPEIDITVSGGIGSWSDIEELDRLGLRSVIVGKAIYEGRISFDQLRVTAR